MTSMLGLNVRWRLTIGVTAAIGGSFLAGCCGGPFSADGDKGGCTACMEEPLTKAKADANANAADSGCGRAPESGDPDASISEAGASAN